MVWNVAGMVLPAAVAIVVVRRLISGLGTERFGLLTIAWVVVRAGAERLATATIIAISVSVAIWSFLLDPSDRQRVTDMIAARMARMRQQS